jgi:hypothetical protein
MMPGARVDRREGRPYIGGSGRGECQSHSQRAYKTALLVKAALLYYEQRPSLSRDDQAHIRRWLSVAEDPVWAKIIRDLEASELPPIHGGLFSLIVSRSLRARQRADTCRYETARMKKQRMREAEKRNETPPFGF